MKMLDLHLDIYSMESVIETVKVYSKIARIRIERKENYSQVIFEGCRYDEKRTSDEFENYLIGLENSKHGIN